VSKFAFSLKMLEVKKEGSCLLEFALKSERLFFSNAWPRSNDSGTSLHSLLALAAAFIEELASH